MSSRLKKGNLMVHRLITVTFLLPYLGFMTPAQVVRGQQFDERFDDWPTQLKINGRVIAAGSLKDMTAIEPLLGGSDEARKLLLVCASTERGDLEEIYRPWVSEVDFVSDLAALKDTADYELLAWHTSSDFHVERPLASELEEQRRLLWQHVEAGKTLIAIGPGATLLSAVHAHGSEPHPNVRLGFGLLPDCVLQLDYDIALPPSEIASLAPEPTNGLAQKRLLSVLAMHPRRVGIGLDSQTALLLDGRKMRVAGAGKATFLLMANERQPLRVEQIAPRTSRRQRPTEWLIDLTEWRRDAIDRTLEPFPAPQPRQPHLDNGTLFIVGGGGMPDGLMGDFIAAAGGVESAKLVYVPCSEQEQVTEPGIVRSWRDLGVQHATYIHTKDRHRANDDTEFLSPLQDATGIWFGGGRQWNFSDSYYGTTAHRLMKEVLHRGGAIGGSSAGASIQARYLARATPIENFRIMAPGYERGGLGFLSGVAIDQHFSQRGRQKDMTQLVNRYPQLLGIGIDETTALIVKSSVGRVVGRGKVHFYNRELPVYPDQPDFLALESGQCYDLAQRQVCDEPREDE